MFKKTKTKIKGLLKVKNQLKLAVYFIGLVTILCSLYAGLVNFTRFLHDPIGQEKLISTLSWRAPKANAKKWEYNQRVPREVSEAYIENNPICKKVGVNFIKKIISCENTEWDNTMKTHLHGTAVGLPQYTIGTWYETDSWKIHKKARTDFRASIDEMCEDIYNGEIWRWSSSKNCWQKK